MYCSKCGAENKDDSLFCTKCGEKILDVNVKDDKGAEIKGVEKDKTNLFSAHLLNIIAFCLPVLMTLGMFLVIPQMSKMIQILLPICLLRLNLLIFPGIFC